MLCAVTRTLSTCISLAALASVAALAPGCSDQKAGTDQTAAAAAAATWEEVKAYTAERSAEFGAYLDRQMTELDGSMASLAARGGAGWAATQADLEAKRAALAAQMQELGAATGAAWTAAKERTVELYEDLRDSLHAASADTGK